MPKLYKDNNSLFGSLYSIISVTSLEVTEKGYTRAAIKEIFK